MFISFDREEISARNIINPYKREPIKNFSVQSWQENVSNSFDEFHIFGIVKKMFDAITAKITMWASYNLLSICPGVGLLFM